jgi:hypothetical protein
MDSTVMFQKFPVSPRLDLVLLMTGTNDIGSVKPSGFSGEFIVEHETGPFFPALFNGKSIARPGFGSTMDAVDVFLVEEKCARSSCVATPKENQKDRKVTHRYSSGILLFYFFFVVTVEFDTIMA